MIDSKKDYNQKTWRQFRQDFCIGITGGIATGKSSICDFLRSQNYVVLDADQLSRKAIEKGSPGFKRCVEAFGNDILNNQGEIDRLALGNIVFNDDQAKQKIEEIVHPELERLSYEALAATDLFISPGYWFYEASLIFEKNLQQQFKQVWMTDCDEKTQLARLMERNSLDKEQALVRIGNQWPASQKRKLADQIIDTSGSLEDSRNQVLKLIAQLPHRSQ